ncbi:glycosyltransferase family 4 protein [Paenibacillus sp. SSG-1]|uniref:glycosyltransferase family 4 protein n=1 Tax=Paenibacillus sp. SSG-1 TaxID=1443669 RepID=UPI000B7EA013|nr:glycosyltransferase family 4 protein [Paenibacillus sp. SSG-1]
MKVAIVHDWLVTYTGAEKVLEQMIDMYPDADLFCVIDNLDEKDRHFIKYKEPVTTFLQHIPFAKKHYRNLLPLMPLAIEQLDLSDYDMILSSSHAVAKGIITGPSQLHISYVHSPIRYAWDLQHQYLKESGLQRGMKGALVRFFLHYIRHWDYRTSNGVDYFVANSNFIAKRIYKVYRRESKVIYPPVDISSFVYSEEKEDYYFTASRMVPYKKMDLIVEAFGEMPDKKLIVIGDGPEMPKIMKKAKPNVTLLGYQPNNVLREHMQRAKAFIFAAEEDFGITPVEAQACGTPVIAFEKGGALETVNGLDTPHPTGLFFSEQTTESIIDAVQRFGISGNRIQFSNCRDNALRFSNQRFKEELSEYINTCIRNYSPNTQTKDFEYSVTS